MFCCIGRQKAFIHCCGSSSYNLVQVQFHDQSEANYYPHQIHKKKCVLIQILRGTLEVVIKGDVKV